MISIQRTKDKTLIRTLLTDPKLFEMSGSTGLPKDFIIPKGFKFLLIKEDNDILGCFHMKELTKVTIACHINLLSKYWGKGRAIESCQTVFKYLKNLGYIKAFTDVPIVCEHVIRLLELIGSKPCGIIKQGVVFKDRLVDLLLYDYDLRGSNV